MPLPSALVGASGEPLTQDVDARWTMAYAAALGQREDCFFDTRDRPDVLAHPLFPVCFEWPLLIGPRHLPVFEALPPGERVLGVHASHHLELHRPLRAGTRVTTRARAVLAEARKPGAYLVTRLDSVDDAGEALCTTWYGTLYRGVALEGGDRSEAGALPASSVETSDSAAGATRHEIPIPAGMAHVYSECARIWNPIHTDAAVAHGAGLPEIILHGTATLALSVSRIVSERLDGDFERVRTVAARFGAMVPMDTRCALRVGDAAPFRFELSSEAGGPAIRDGIVGTA